MVVPEAVRSRRRAAAALVCAFMGAAVLAGCSNSVGGAGDTGYVAAAKTGVTNIDPGQREAAPTLSGTTLDGKKLALADYRGKVVVVNVWGSWCAPCRLEAPALEETYQKYQAKGVQFLGINVRDTNASALAFVGADGLTYPSLQDPDETLLLAFKTVVPPTDIPSSIIVDRSGKVATRIIGGTTEPQLAQALDKVLSGS
ncbi:TlpA family protein disulfide reductase [Actinocrinis puniceicyclus]|uniref:TlpA family protein disulfide reductase n=1 Tax=Actinocrinis puniceicyclus TaxID=977794 RepID=A0A8J7WM23_9ACTN|nr:TlpA disulfide reductase family protein [Actinocrinis puniceicyclus]MBS2962177.1 TlpA family protein disulfide reductase [Actinocrinis puniceicyclus]